MGKRLLVFGSYVTDLCGRTDRFPEAGETVKGRTFQMGPGGKGSNQAVAAKRAGADVTFITRLGADPLGRQALDFYRSEGMDTGHIIIDPDQPTGAALITVNETDAQNEIVVVGGACEHFTAKEIGDILPCLERAELLLLQLETNLEPVEALLGQARSRGVLTILDPAPARPLGEAYFASVDILTPNETEAQALTGIRADDREGARAAARALLAKGVGKVVITLGGDGCYACDGREERFFPPVSCGTVVDTTGAGDAFSGGMAAALAEGMEFFDAVLFGTVTAGLAVTRQGTAPAMPSGAEIWPIYRKIRDRGN